MGVYINMEMPKNCDVCRFRNGQANTDYGVCAWCNVDGKAHGTYATQDCPLVPIPSYGDLIENKAFLKVAHKTDDFSLDELAHLATLVAATPTIIPAEESNMDSFIHIFEEDDEEDEMDSFIQILKD